MRTPANAERVQRFMMELFDRIVPQLIRYPSLDPESLIRKLKTFVAAHT